MVSVADFKQRLGIEDKYDRFSNLKARVIEPAVKEAVRLAAAREHRSVANMVEVLIRRHCNASGIAIEHATSCMTST